jgi:hypothetical protein
MLTGVTRKMAGDFFKAVDADIAGFRAPAPATGAGPDAGAESAGHPLVGQRHTAVVRMLLPPGWLWGERFALGVAVGGLVALAGVALGAAIRGASR